MGINNRQRRRAKQKHRHLRDGRRSGAEGGQHRRGPTDDTMIRNAVLAAAEAFRSGSRVAFDSWLSVLQSMACDRGQASVDAAVAWGVDQALGRAWEYAWQPADVVRVVRRVFTARHAEVVAPHVATSGARRPEASHDGRWVAQISALAHDGPAAAPAGPPDATSLTLAIEALSLLLYLPRLPPLSAPSAQTRQADGRSGAMLERVRALLAKAESTTFPEEAEALTAKAHELMARHAIDEAMLRTAPGAPADGVVGWRIGIDDPYARAKSLLLDRVARANRCRAVWSSQLGFSTVFGHVTDLETTELLFTSLLVQATAAMTRAGRSGSGEAGRRSRTRGFRQSFLVAYAVHIGERLDASAAAAVAEGSARHGDRLLPALVAQTDRVDEAVREAFPDLGSNRMAAGDHNGWIEGWAAAELASLRVGEELAAG